MMKGIIFRKKNQKLTKLIIIFCISFMYMVFIACGGGGGNDIPDIQPSPSDIQPPTSPSSLTATAVSPDIINLTWSACTDNVGVTGYKIYRNDVPLITVSKIPNSETIKYIVQIVPQHSQLSTQASNNSLVHLSTDQLDAYELTVAQMDAVTSYSDTGLTPNTTFCYAVAALDAAGNESVKCPEVCATTLTVGCGTGLPLVLSSLNFPTSVVSGGSQNGSAAYSGSFEAILNAVMIAQIPSSAGGAIYTANFAPVTASNCSITFTIRIPQGLSGTGPINFRLVDYDSNLTLIENWNAKSVSNQLSQQVTFN